MNAVIATKFGGLDKIELREVAEPVVGPHDVLIDVRAASLNPVDIKIAKGELKLVLSVRPPIALGCDVAGVVAARGAEVTELAVGDEVYGRLEKNRMGGLAERVAADARVLARKPANLGFDEAAALPLVTLTALQTLRDAAHATAGQRVLIHAGAGGLGSVAIQIAKILGLHVIATASAKNHALLRELGADDVIDYTCEACDARGKVDLVLDTMGDTEIASLEACKPGGIVVGVAGLPDAEFARAAMPWFAPAAIWVMTRKRRAAVARTGVRYKWVFMMPNAAQLAEVAGYVETGKLKPLIHRIYPLAEAGDALAELARGRSRGKIVIHV